MDERVTTYEEAISYLDEIAKDETKILNVSNGILYNEDYIYKALKTNIKCLDAFFFAGDMKPVNKLLADAIYRAKDPKFLSEVLDRKTLAEDSVTFVDSLLITGCGICEHLDEFSHIYGIKMAKKTAKTLLERTEKEKFYTQKYQNLICDYEPVFANFMQKRLNFRANQGVLKTLNSRNFVQVMASMEPSYQSIEMQVREIRLELGLENYKSREF